MSDDDSTPTDELFTGTGDNSDVTADVTHDVACDVACDITEIPLPIRGSN